MPGQPSLPQRRLDGLDQDEAGGERAPGGLKQPSASPAIMANSYTTCWDFDSERAGTPHRAIWFPTVPAGRSITPADECVPGAYNRHRGCLMCNLDSGPGAGGTHPSRPCGQKERGKAIRAITQIGPRDGGVSRKQARSQTRNIPRRPLDDRASATDTRAAIDRKYRSMAREREPPRRRSDGFGRPASG